MNCNKCPSKKAVAEMNRIPLCRGCFQKMITRRVSAVRGLLVH
jgi:hypothetical protein